MDEISEIDSEEFEKKMIESLNKLLNDSQLVTMNDYSPVLSALSDITSEIKSKSEKTLVFLAILLCKHYVADDY